MHHNEGNVIQSNPAAVAQPNQEAVLTPHESVSQGEPTTQPITGSARPEVRVNT